MVQKSFLVTILTLFIILNSSVANDRQILFKDEEDSLTNKFDKILLEKDYRKHRVLNPHFMLPAEKLKNSQIFKDYTLPADFWVPNVSRERAKNSFNALGQLISDWLNREEIVRKRAHHRALCHFKICNMGLKRNSWNTLSSEIEPDIKNF